MKRKTALVLSIDFDFFPWNGGMAHGVDCGTSDARTNPFLYDWGHSEAHPPALLDALWLVRRAAFSRAGTSIEAASAIDPERGCTPIDEFVATLRSTIGGLSALGNAPAYLSESHAWGFPIVASHARPANLVVNFDAHHDLGYGPEVKDEAKRGSATCGSWLFHVLDRGFAKRAIVVYPDWRDREPHEAEWIRRIRDRVDFVTWSAWRRRGPLVGTVTAVHLARSGSWVPPHHDAEFLRLRDALGLARARCLDCRPVSDGRIGAGDACSPRRTDAGQAAVLIDGLRNFGTQKKA